MTATEEKIDQYALRMWLIRNGDKETARTWLLSISRQLQSEEPLDREELGFLGFVLFKHWHENKAEEFWLAGKKPHVSYRTNKHLSAFACVEKHRELNPGKKLKEVLVPALLELTPDAKNAPPNQFGKLLQRLKSDHTVDLHRNMTQKRPFIVFKTDPSAAT